MARGFGEQGDGAGRPVKIQARSCLSLVALAIVLGGCTPDPAPQPEPVAFELPREDQLAYLLGVNTDCGCLLRHECVVVEEVPGAFEVRNAECRWVTPGQIAECRFEGRFTEVIVRAGREEVGIPGTWTVRTMRARLLPNGGWCR